MKSTTKTIKGATGIVVGPTWVEMLAKMGKLRMMPRKEDDLHVQDLFVKVSVSVNTPIKYKPMETNETK